MLCNRHRDGIMGKAGGGKAVRGRPLRASEKRFTKLISKRRFRVEHCFGSMKRLLGKRLFGRHRAQYCGLAKTHAQPEMAARGQTLLKAVNTIKMNPQAQAIA
jgi:IS5 family transposase